ncbi:hypothetical protein F5Y15DRAFT_368723 [Xylariaceae sp. FL0016]|nr:hypothetical protein F5Y15DRAFT_368723 [Xylariaceae sp. FL0016]
MRRMKLEDPVGDEEEGKKEKNDEDEAEKVEVKRADEDKEKGKNDDEKGGDEMAQNGEEVDWDGVEDVMNVELEDGEWCHVDKSEGENIEKPQVQKAKPTATQETSEQEGFEEYLLIPSSPGEIACEWLTLVPEPPTKEETTKPAIPEPKEAEMTPKKLNMATLLSQDPRTPMTLPPRTPRPSVAPGPRSYTPRVESWAIPSRGPAPARPTPDRYGRYPAYFGMQPPLPPGPYPAPYDPFQYPGYPSIPSHYKLFDP